MPVPSPRANGSGCQVEHDPCLESFQRGLNQLAAEYSRLFSHKNMLEVENLRLQDLLTSAALDVACELRDLDVPSTGENGCKASIKELSSTDRYTAAKPTLTVNGQHGQVDIPRSSMTSSEPHSALSVLIPRHESITSSKDGREARVRITTASVPESTVSQGLPHDTQRSPPPESCNC
eukprot:987215-Amphidinium_carterae.1